MTTTTAPSAGTRYDDTWQSLSIGFAPSVPMTRSVRGSLRVSEAGLTFDQPVGSVSCAPPAPRAMSSAAAATAVAVRATTAVAAARALRCRIGRITDSAWYV